jgi:hypothetical protein
MLPLRERPEFKRRYSSIAGLFLHHVFAHGDVLQFFWMCRIFFESRRARTRAARIADAKYRAQPGMTCISLTIGLLLQSTQCIRAGRQRIRRMFAHWHSRRVPKCRSRFGDQGFTKRRRPSIRAVNEKASNVIAGLDPAIHLLARMMDTRVKPAYDGFH